MDLTETAALDILDPDDKLMKKFQETFHTHLTDVNNRLSEEIYKLETSIKQSEEELEFKGVHLYQTQQEIDHQHTIILQYIEALSQLTLLREKRCQSIEDAKNALKEHSCKLKEEKNKKEELSQKLNNLLALYSYLSKWEKDLNDYLKKSKQISSQDTNKRKTLINKKQQRDFILYQLKEEVWRIEADIAHLDEQLQIKDREKEDTNRMIIDVNTDLETLHAEHKGLHITWKSLVANICKRNNFHDQLQSQQEEVNKLYDALLLEIRKVKRETEKEMEKNEHLTSLSFRIDNDVRIVSKKISMYNEKIADIELQLIKLAKVDEQTQCDYNIIFAKYQNCSYTEQQANKKFEIILEKKNNVEDTIFKKLDEKVVCDKTAQYINELLLNTKTAVLQHEITVARLENLCSNNRLKLERLKNLTANQKVELEELLQKNEEKVKQLDELERDIEKYETIIERKQRKFLGINKLIKQIAPNIGSEDFGLQDLKIISLTKNIQEFVQNIQKLQQFWMRQQGFMVSLSYQRESQLRELNLLDKEIMIMGQKNFKLEYMLEMLTKEEANINKMIVSLTQKVLHINSDLVIQKDLKEDLEDKNCIIKNECILSFQELELELIKLQSDLKNSSNEKMALKEELKSTQQENSSWEKKVQLLHETIKEIKDERSAGAIPSMKNEIHKMEMRLSHLRRIQEKLIHDMELCIGRRDIIITKAIGRLNKNPKERHNEKVTMHKRLIGQQSKIKQFSKIIKQTGDAVEQLKSEINGTMNKFSNSRQVLRNLKEHISNIEDEINQIEMLKYHKLHSLILKQRKVKQLYNIKTGNYKMIYRNGSIIEENMKIEHTYQQYLKHIIEKTNHDFPMLKFSLRKILLTLQIL
ncbi:coiled-coil domain-containing protein 40 isoform X1 [Hylaeus anthracinus]|uniref:coiled-coil domain-containing protein 40 isoform X1 n=1 Tax=Hylaeus anthracinus TaxID=313031 RepID=UPI0023B9FB24|nr:coiled-coil domain-containing protein 40 isoform X1 [Hylaeus anthracinus]XP_054004987.1 coiled-coil domain-containing protein 40 isoform X1 [Hylaeus anthracinus]